MCFDLPARVQIHTSPSTDSYTGSKLVGEFSGGGVLLPPVPLQQITYGPVARCDKWMQIRDCGICLLTDGEYVARLRSTNPRQAFLARFGNLAKSFSRTCSLGWFTTHVFLLMFYLHVYPPSPGYVKCQAHTEDVTTVKDMLQPPAEHDNRIWNMCKWRKLRHAWAPFETCL